MLANQRSGRSNVSGLAHSNDYVIRDYRHTAAGKVTSSSPAKSPKFQQRGFHLQNRYLLYENDSTSTNLKEIPLFRILHSSYRKLYRVCE